MNEKKEITMNLLIKFSILGSLLFAVPQLYSQENEKGCNSSKNIKNKYKKHIENTVWIVPPSTLLAYEYANGSEIPVSDQTVWVIDQYDNGYFFGSSYTALNGTPSSQRNILGSITPSGDVYITFYPLSDDTQDTDIVNGIGTFEKHNGKYLFVMQMNSAQNNPSGLAHWSYMISVKPDDYFYQHLPGLDISVPMFISEFSQYLIYL